MQKLIAGLLFSKRTDKWASLGDIFYFKDSDCSLHVGQKVKFWSHQTTSPSNYLLRFSQHNCICVKSKIYKIFTVYKLGNWFHCALFGRVTEKGVDTSVWKPNTAFFQLHNSAILCFGLSLKSPTQCKIGKKIPCFAKLNTFAIHSKSCVCHMLF